MSRFYDSDPGNLDTIPGHYPPGAQYAALYGDTSLVPGYRPQPNPGIPNVRYITRRGGAAGAAYAGIADFELGNLVYESTLLQQWAEWRANGEHLARTYCNRSDVAKAWPQVGHLANTRWWIATLDNYPDWTPDSIVASVAAITGIELDPGTIWGIQWGKGNVTGYDTSTLFLPW